MRVRAVMRRADERPFWSARCFAASTWWWTGTREVLVKASRWTDADEFGLLRPRAAPQPAIASADLSRCRATNDAGPRARAPPLRAGRTTQPPLFIKTERGVGYRFH
jgi:hypothetical protein